MSLPGSDSLATFRMLVQMALRNLAAHRIKSVVVGSIMFFGTFLVVSGTALLDSVQDSMTRSITNSLSGHAQVYDADAKDPLSLFPSGSMGTMDYGEIDDFQAVRRTLLQVEGVKDVVPMGITNTIIFGGTELDRVIEGLRQAVEQGDQTAVQVYAAHVRSLSAALRRDVEKTLEVSADPDGVRQELATLDRVQSDAFWVEFQLDPQAGLQLLDTRLAPIADDGRLLYLRIIGTDVALFTQNFDSFQLVEGQLPPEGEPGLLIAQRFYETQVKDKVARSLDELREGREDGKSIAEDAVLKLVSERLPKQTQRVLVQLSPPEAEAMTRELRERLPGVEGDASALVTALLTVDDQSFDAHYALFYEVVAPRIRLYEIPVGSEVILRGFTKTGYARAEKVKVWGTFTFTGLEGSDLAGFNNLVDLDTFRSLYGRMTTEQQAELSDIKAAAGVADISRESAEDDLFGDGPAPVAVAAATPSGEAAPADPDVVLNAAVILDDPATLQRTLAQARQRLDEAGLGVQVVDWQQASGIVGQIILVLQAVLLVSIVVIFLVALVIINNTMVMTTMERTVEIGTMRAIGAQRRFVTVLFVVETLALGFIAGSLGAVAGVGLILVLHQVGIPAPADIMVLLFAGRFLYPVVTVGNVLLGFVTIMFISLLSTFYPAVLAARVPPVVAMSGKE